MALISNSVSMFLLVILLSGVLISAENRAPYGEVGLVLYPERPAYAVAAYWSAFVPLHLQPSPGSDMSNLLANIRTDSARIDQNVISFEAQQPRDKDRDATQTSLDILHVQSTQINRLLTSAHASLREYEQSLETLASVVGPSFTTTPQPSLQRTKRTPPPINFQESGEIDVETSEPTLRRSKRFTLIPLVGRMYKWLWGTATLDDLVNIQDQVKVMEDMSNRTTRELGTIRDQMVSIMQSSTLLVEAEINKTNYIVEDLESRLEKWSSNVTKEIRQLQIQQTRQVSQTYLLSLRLSQEGLFSRLNTIQDYMTKSTRRVSAIFQATTQSIADPLVINQDILTHILASVRANCPVGLTLTPSGNSEALYQHMSVDLAVSDKMLMALVKVPLLQDKPHAQFFRVARVPIFVRGMWLVITDVPDYVQIDKDHHTYIGFSAEEYQDCQNQWLSACKIPLVTSSLGDGSCIGAVLQDVTTYRKHCHLEPTNQLMVNPPAIVPLGDNSWLISDNTTGETVTQKCILANGRASTINLMIASLTVITLREGCSMEFRSKTIMAPYVAGTTDEFSVTALVPLHLAVRGSAPVQGLREVMMTSRQLIEPLELGQLDTSSYDVLIKEGRVRVDALIAAQSEQQGVYMTDMQAMHVELQNLRDASTAQWSSFWTIPWYYEIGVFIAIGVWLLLLTYLACCRARPAALLAGASYSFPMAQATSLPTPNNTTCALLPAIGNDVNMISVMIITMVIMIVVHGVCYWHLHRRMTAQHNRELESLNYAPRNRKSPHFLGEIKIYVCLLVEWGNITGSRLHVDELIFQACTLPGIYADWYSLPKGDPSALGPLGSGTRLSSRLCCSIPWSSFCLKSVLFTNVDTCEELTPLVEVLWEDLEYQMPSKMKFWWWSYKVIRVQKISAVSPAGVKELFNFVNLAAAQVAHKQY